jgi:hypothetical protein
MDDCSAVAFDDVNGGDSPVSYGLQRRAARGFTAQTGFSPGQVEVDLRPFGVVFAASCRSPMLKSGFMRPRSLCQPNQ